MEMTFRVMELDDSRCGPAKTYLEELSMRQLQRFIVLGAALAGLAACQGMTADGPKATATLQPTKGSTVRGTATFMEHHGKVHVTANVTGLVPNREFGFHIHEAGDCSSGDGESAKGHFNP